MSKIEGYSGKDLRFFIASLAYKEAEDKLATTKIMNVCNDTFEACLEDMSEHYKKIHRKRGYLRTYHKPFFRPTENGKGQIYCHGVVNIINEDHPDNKEYVVETESLDLDLLVWTVEDWVKQGYEVVNADDVILDRDSIEGFYKITFKKNRGLD